MADSNTSKSGIEGPGGYNSKTPPNLNAPTKIYPGSHNLGKGADSSGKGGDCIEGPLSSSSKK